LSLVPDLIITSDAVRAQTTAQLAAESAGYGGAVTLSSALYHAAPAAVIDVVRNAAETANRLMIVGHNPGLEDLVSQLTGEDVGLSTATLVHIDVPVKRWSEIDLGSGSRLIESWHPDEM
jgi:phosphohistidine phosphatase